MRHRAFNERPIDLYLDSTGQYQDAGVDFEMEKPRYPGISCATPGNPYVLHCFPPYKYQLTAEQQPHLKYIADKIKASFTSTHPITKVSILGHASTWHRTPRKKLEERSIQRAGNAANELYLLLYQRGVAGKVIIDADGRSDTINWRGKPYSSTSGSKAAQAQRALNRRVEIRMIKKSPPKPIPKKKCRHRDMVLANKLETMPMAGLTQDRAQKSRMQCLKKVLISALRCEKRIDDTYLLSLFDPKHRFTIEEEKAFEQRSVIQDLKTYFRLNCKGKSSGTQNAKCFKMLFDDVSNSIADASILASAWKGDTHLPPETFSKSEHCYPLCFMFKKVKRKHPRSIYFCFIKVLNRIEEKVCKKCHLR